MILVDDYDMEENLKETDLQLGPVKTVATGFKFTEGPVWHPDGYLLFSDIPANRIYMVDPDGRSKAEVFREPSGNSNGLTLDRQGRLVACEHGNRRVTRIEKDGRLVVLAQFFLEKRLNSPNDVVVASNGTVFFTDPPYGIKSEHQEQPCSGVYRIDPDGSIRLLVDDFPAPNGLAFAPDESILYIDDSRRQHIRAFDVTSDGGLTGGRIFADLSDPEDGVPDGMKVDEEGNVYATNARGVWVFDSRGEFRGLIAVPEVPANCAWGDDGQTLFMTARTSIYKVHLRIPGCV